MHSLMPYFDSYNKIYRSGCMENMVGRILTLSFYETPDVRRMVHRIHFRTHKFFKSRISKSADRKFDFHGSWVRLYTTLSNFYNICVLKLKTIKIEENGRTEHYGQLVDFLTSQGILTPLSIKVCSESSFIFEKTGVYLLKNSQNLFLQRSSFE